MKRYFLKLRGIALFTLPILIVTFLIGCSKDDTNSDCKEKIDPNVVCITLYDPVCGCNNKTYSNSCVAAASGISTFTKGECAK